MIWHQMEHKLTRDRRQYLIQTTPTLQKTAITVAYEP